MNPIAPTTVSMYLNGLQSDLRTAMLSSKPQEVIEQMTWDNTMKLSQDQSNALQKYTSKRLKTSSSQSQNTRGNGQQQRQQQQSHGKGGKGKHGKGRGKDGKGKGKDGKGKGKGKDGGKNRSQGKNGGKHGGKNQGADNLRPALSREDRDYYVQHGMCFDCGQTGHRPGDPRCPARQNALPQSQVHQIAEEATRSIFDRLSWGPNQIPNQGNVQASLQPENPNQIQAAGSQRQYSDSRALVLHPNPVGVQPSGMHRW